MNVIVGHKVDLADGVAIVGAPEHDSSGTDSGAAYVYRFDPVTSQWGFEAKFTAYDAIEGEQFGFGLAAQGKTVAMGAIFDYNNGENSGSGYVIDLDGRDCDPPVPPICMWDLDGTESVGVADLLELLAQWGTPGTADFNRDGIVNTADLLILFANWGPCP